jgi:mono/diheme cytochrome c family protein
MRQPALWGLLVLLAIDLVAPGPPGAVAAPAGAGDAARGRELYHGIGGCAYCHGIAGTLAHRPTMSPELAGEIARLPRPPADLRNPESLRSQDENQRFLSIKFGHPGTAMFGKPFLTDEEIGHLLAYLAVLRHEPPATNPPSQ